MKALLLILGTILVSIGLLMLAGFLIQYFDGSMDFSLAEQIIALVIFIIAPLSLGGFFLHRALNGNKNSTET